LEGDYGAEHLFGPETAVELYDVYQLLRIGDYTGAATPAFMA
jgi:hypothetical protein